MEKSTKLLRSTQILFGVNAAVMLFVGIMTLIRPPQSSLGLTVFTASLVLIDAALLIGCALIVPKRQRWLNLAAVALLVANILLTVTDEVGLPDLIILVFFITNLVLLFLTIKELRR